MWRDVEGRTVAYGYSVFGRRWLRIPGVGAFTFDPQLDEIRAVADPGATKVAVIEAYRRAVLPMFQPLRRRQVLHASGVRTSAGVVALCGKSGIGKSTLAYAFALRGYGVWGDDAVCFTATNHGVQTIPLPFDLLLQASTAEFFDSLSETAQIGRPEPEIETLAPLSAICILRRRIGDPATRRTADIASFSSADAFTATLEHAYYSGLSDKDQRRHLVEQYLQLAASTPVFAVTFEHGLERVEAVVEVIEQRLGLEPPEP